MTVEHGEPLALPGLEVEIASTRRRGAIEDAALAQLKALRDADRLTADHGIVVALVVELCATISGARGKPAAMAMAAKQLVDVMDKLPPLVEAAESSEWADVLAALGPPAADVEP